MMNISYPINKKTPLYPNTPELKISGNRSQKNGDSSNNSLITIPSHYGTHIDAPRHFCEDGTYISDLTQKGEINLKNVYCISLPKQADMPITSEDILSLPKEIHNAEGILIKTGFCAERLTNPSAYTGMPPWVQGNVPASLRKLFPNLKLYGSDTISVSSPLHREEGHVAHKEFLCNAKQPILLLEDINLNKVSPSLLPYNLTLYPYFDEALDGSPVVALLW
ncbi:MAG: cyclase family protein [Methanomicrobium sp.]|nr:cyclase family protein [Methanomicrobium sp.]